MLVDIHNHCAWDIDDGMENKENAIKALDTAKADGITKIIATPHFIPGSQSDEDIQKMNARIDELKILAQNIGIKGYKGTELFLNSGYIDMLEEGLCNTLNGSKYLLVEFDVRKDIAEIGRASCRERVCKQV